MSAEPQLVPKQTLLLACCSIPFHDWRFRECLRESYGSCVIGTDSMPYACLLAFVDSIQDDRRDLHGLQNELTFLQRILVRRPSTITAKVNKAAVPRSSLLWKMIEARDVLASLRPRDEALQFSYPHWMTA
jgi:hypothetical protein